jgi:ADP-dependent NAD(P)H-hydrate dehydratase / NAD(P)H-hydrate epimerase
MTQIADAPASRCAVLTVDESYAADAAAAEMGVAGVELMGNAGRAVAEAVRARWQHQPVAVLCGPGNNGGDGFVAARHLAAAGWPVKLALLGERSHLTGDAAHHAAAWDGAVHALSPAVLEEGALVIDALFGAGLSRPLEGAARETIQAVAAGGFPVVAVDVPSGLSGDSGRVLGDALAPADLTVTFFRKKPGHLLLPGRTYCGDLVVADIGIPETVLRGIQPGGFENGPDLWGPCYPWRGPQDHKYRFGHALVVGGDTMTGAARLASRAALRVGAGLVTLACPERQLPIYAMASASVITAPLGGRGDFRSLLGDLRRNAVLLGPGNGINNETRGRALAALLAGRQIVLDADALSVFERDPEVLFDAIAHIGPGAAVLTPHDGEFARLFADLVSNADRLARARAGAAVSGAVVLLKGGDTVIAAADGRAAINTNAPPELATAGTGDVLAGLVVGLLAQGMPAFEAAAAACWLHGEAAQRLGPGLISEDLSEALPAVLADLKDWLGTRKIP